MTTTSGSGSRLPAMVVLAVGAVATLTGCGKPKLNCDRLCTRAERCYQEIMRKQGQLSRSTTRAIEANPSLRRTLQRNLRKVCVRNCKKNNAQGVWSRKDVKRAKKCLKRKRCAALAGCVTEHLK